MKRISRVREFTFQFPVDRVREYAARYAYADDSDVTAMGRAAHERGYYRYDEFLLLPFVRDLRNPDGTVKHAGPASGARA